MANTFTRDQRSISKAVCNLLLDDQTGNKRYITEIVAENLIMLDSKGSSRPATSAGVPLPDETPTIQIDESDMGGNEEIKVEEVPF